MINFESSQITAKCSEKVYNFIQKVIFTKEKVRKTRVQLSYDAAFYVWDKLRWGENKITIWHSGRFEWMIVSIKTKRLSVLESKGGGKLLVEHGWDTIEFFLDRNDLVDPYVVSFKKNVKDLLTDILDDIVNRVEQLRIRDETNFEWKDGKVSFAGLRQAQLKDPLQP